MAKTEPLLSPEGTDTINDIKHLALRVAECVPKAGAVTLRQPARLLRSATAHRTTAYTVQPRAKELPIQYT